MKVLPDQPALAGATAGFTGTRYGLTTGQVGGLWRVLQDLRGRGLRTLHHGMSGKADQTANTFAFELSIWRVGHPVTGWDLDMPVDEQREPLLPLDRDTAIVTESSYLIACPQRFTEERRSGTWATVRRAEKQGKLVVFVWPDGLITAGRLLVSRET